MLREEIVARIEELESLKRWTDTKMKEYYWLKAELEVIDGLTYNDAEWITCKSFTSEKSLSDARLGLAKILSQLNGVKVEEKSGVQIVSVNTKRKVYYYELHAHFGEREVEWEEVEKPVYKMFKRTGETRIEKICTKSIPVYSANLKPWCRDGRPNWYLKY